MRPLAERAGHADAIGRLLLDDRLPGGGQREERKPRRALLELDVEAPERSAGRFDLDVERAAWRRRPLQAV